MASMLAFFVFGSAGGAKYHGLGRKPQDNRFYRVWSVGPAENVERATPSISITFLAHLQCATLF
jgi:hypothetical protein